MACGRPLDLARDAWENGYLTDTQFELLGHEDGAEDPDEYKVNIIHNGYQWVFASAEDQMATCLITVFKIEEEEHSDAEAWGGVYEGGSPFDDEFPGFSHYEW
jgi:hypothetical protein